MEKAVSEHLLGIFFFFNKDLARVVAYFLL